MLKNFKHRPNTHFKREKKKRKKIKEKAKPSGWRWKG
jgi:phage gp29-like protein